MTVRVENRVHQQEIGFHSWRLLEKREENYYVMRGSLIVLLIFITTDI